MRLFVTACLRDLEGNVVTIYRVLHITLRKIITVPERISVVRHLRVQWLNDSPVDRGGHYQPCPTPLSLR